MSIHGTRMLLSAVMLGSLGSAIERSYVVSSREFLAYYILHLITNAMRQLFAEAGVFRESHLFWPRTQEHDGVRPSPPSTLMCAKLDKVSPAMAIVGRLQASHASPSCSLVYRDVATDTPTDALTGDR